MPSFSNWIVKVAAKLLKRQRQIDQRCIGIFKSFATFTIQLLKEHNFLAKQSQKCVKVSDAETHFPNVSAQTRQYTITFSQDSLETLANI